MTATEVDQNLPALTHQSDLGSIFSSQKATCSIPEAHFYNRIVHLYILYIVFKYGRFTGENVEQGPRDA
jgi:hypothetical protein